VTDPVPHRSRHMFRRSLVLLLAMCVAASCTSGGSESERVAEHFAEALSARDSAGISTLAVPELAAALNGHLPKPGDERVMFHTRPPYAEVAGRDSDGSRFFFRSSVRSPNPREDVGVWVLVRETPTPRVVAFTLVPDLYSPPR